LYSTEYEVKSVVEKVWKALQRRFSNPTTARGIVLAGFLNLATPESGLILKILRLLQDAVRTADSAPESLPRWERIEGIDESSEIRIQRTSAWPGFQSMYRANELLKQYKPPLRLETQTNGNSRLRSAPKHETSESEAAHALVMLAEKGWATLSLLRKCPGCEKWFFAKRQNQKCCDEVCKHKKYEKTERFRESRRLYKRAEYWTAKAVNLRYQIGNLSRTREDEKRKKQLNVKRSVALSKAKAANQEREALKEREGAQ
jgi:hypothetical protein